MSTLRLYTTLLLLLLTCWQCKASTQTQETETPPQDEVVDVPSAKMNRDIKCTVVVPEQYFDLDLQDEQYPVVYLLHGYSGDYTNWPEADLDDLASDYSTIIVCPDGQDSWYVDSPFDDSMQFETFISKELVDYVDTHYRTLRQPGFRAISGLSMGGHGALFLAFRHPDVFGSCGSMSGCMDITQFPDKWKIAQRLGNYEDNKQLWVEHSVMGQLDNISPKLNIIIDDGSEDFFYNVNLELHQALLERNVKHDFTIRPGGHSWTYWLNSLDYHMLFFAKAFDNAQ